mmetsp:Transcript_515/g.664  ORF Transcript_515/g.664 Transcript_515/m.664 type:complete len:241 (+) Transcript_515:435-1157(+)
MDVFVLGILVHSNLINYGVLKKRTVVNQLVILRLRLSVIISLVQLGMIDKFYCGMNVYFHQKSRVFKFLQLILMILIVLPFPLLILMRLIFYSRLDQLMVQLNFGIAVFPNQSFIMFSDPRMLLLLFGHHLKLRSLLLPVLIVVSLYIILILFINHLLTKFPIKTWLDLNLKIHQQMQILQNFYLNTLDTPINSMMYHGIYRKKCLVHQLLLITHFKYGGFLMRSMRMTLMILILFSLPF